MQNNEIIWYVKSIYAMSGLTAELAAYQLENRNIEFKITAPSGKLLLSVDAGVDINIRPGALDTFETTVRQVEQILLVIPVSRL